MEYSIIRSRRKTLCLSINAEGNLIVRAPYRTSVEEIRTFVSRHERWAAKRLLAYENAPKLNVSDGAELSIFGRKFIIQEGGARISSDNIFLPANCKDETLRALLKRESARYMLTLTENIAAIYGFMFSRVRISSARGRWGSYSRKGTVSYSFRIAFLPPDLAEYVAVHELCHSKHFDHSPAFWREVEKILPDYRARRKRLKSMGYIMNFL